MVQAQAQSNIKSIVKSNHNILEIKELANAYFDEKYCDEPECLVEDSEYHKYKRWEWYWENRVTEKGTMPNMADVAKSIDRFKLGLNAKDSSIFSQELYDWKNINQTTSESGYNGMGRVTSMGFHPTDPNTYFVGAPQGGIWKTTTSGFLYENIGEDLPYVSVGNIIVHPDNPDTIYISVGDHTGWWNYGLGIYKTTDGGKTWNPTGFAHELHNTISIIDIAVCPKNPDLMIVASGQGLYKTEDGFETVRKIRDGEYNSVKFNPLDSALVMVTHKQYENSLVLRSENAGATWGSATGFESQQNWVGHYVQFSPQDPSYVYVVASDSKFYQSTDFGRSFTYKSDVPSYGPLIVSGTDKNKVFCGFISIHETLDGGASWNQKTNWYNNGEHPTVHADLRNCYHNPHDSTQMFVCNDGGIYLHSEQDSSWVDLSDGLIITQFYTMANAQTHDIIMIGGTQDNGGRKRNSFGKWFPTNGGDAMEVQIDHTNHTIFYTTYINGLLYRSRDSWENDVYHCISCNIPGKEDDSNGSWVTPYELDPNDANTIVAGYERVWKSTDQGDNWLPLGDTLYGGRDIRSLAIAPSNSDVIAVGIDDQFFLTTNNGEDWTNFDKPTGANVTSITFDPLDENRIWLTLSGYNPFYRVLYSEDQGNSWENLTFDLPNVPINTSAFLNSEQGEIIIIGTDIGLFVKTISGDKWVRYGTNLPFTHVTDIEFQYNADKIRISTFGRGIWEAPMPKSTSSIAETNETLLHCYPNPAVGKLNVVLESNEATQLEIFDAAGRLKITQTSFTKQNEVDISLLEKGIYFIKSSNGRTQKFVKI